jgi:nitroreductase
VRLIADCRADELDSINGWWDLFAHDHQCEPPADWRTWLILGGRGAGKTRAGAEWVRDAARDGRARIALVGETEHDVREVMIEGVSGVLAVHPDDERPQWSSSRRRLEWNNGAAAEAFSAEQPDSLRGPQFSHAWCDELAKWRHRQFANNYIFFGAPAALFFAREKAHGPAQWADIGGYLQTVCLLARDYGLHTCPQQAWVSFHKTVRDFLNLPENLMVYSGMALGFADESAPINRWRSPREPLGGFATFSGFAN